MPEKATNENQRYAGGDCEVSRSKLQLPARFSSRRNFKSAKVIARTIGPMNTPSPPKAFNPPILKMIRRVITSRCAASLCGIFTSV